MKLMEPRARFATGDDSTRIPIFAVYHGDSDLLDRLPADIAASARAAGWTPGFRTPFAVRNRDSCVSALLFPIGVDPWPGGGVPFPFGSLPALLGGHFPTGRSDTPEWQIEGLRNDDERNAAALGWLLGSYQYNAAKEMPLLACPKGVDAGRMQAVADAVCLARRLVSTPANVLGPAALAEAAGELAELHGATYRCIDKEETIRKEWPLLHAVGQAGHQQPRVAEIRWGDTGQPSVTVVGKGITFDTGGVDLKPARLMRLMKKDMGGAASALALAHMAMACELPVCLRVLLPIAENAVSSKSFRPGDVYRSRSSVTVEIGDTDAEGRLILADALDVAAADKPDLLLDFATLTGSARVALGQDLPALYTDDDALAADLVSAGIRDRDPLWRMPLWAPYLKRMKSEFAEISSTGTVPGAGSITAALFLQRFVPKDIRWAHVDLFNWNLTSTPGRPVGGECQAARACFAVLESRYGGA